jgi:phage FluMu protein Com
MFESEWDQGSLFGWEETISKISGTIQESNQANPLHCIACNKTYSNDNVFMHHKKGKPHIKAVNELSKKGVANLEKTAQVSEEGKSQFSEV